MTHYPEHSNIAKNTRKKNLKDLKTNCMKMKDILKDKMNEYLKGIQEKKRSNNGKKSINLLKFRKQPAQ